ncbi:MAG: pilus assembly protein N-terminal domain-containing protein [Myxococcales bacterium]|nr:pilus assembly protein N-terminal domain-containing protein [Myxococcales bacterium]
MSDENEGPPPLSPELHEFFEAHAKTGEPTQAELGRALLRLHGATRPTRLSVGGRRLLPPEILAVAAVLVLSVGGAFIGWRVRSANAQTEALSTAKAAWVRGDLEAASAAFEACSTAECARLAAAVKRAKVQSENIAGLDEAEAGSLLALDRELSGGARSVMGDRLEQEALPEESEALFAAKQGNVMLMAGHDQTKVTSAVSAFVHGSAIASSSPELARPLLKQVSELVPDTALARAAQKKLESLEAAPLSPKPANPTVSPGLSPELTALLQRAKVAKKEHRYDEAISLLEQCLRDEPSQPECVLTLASTFAFRGSETNSHADNTRALSLYKQFLEVADPTDKYIERVREILKGASLETQGQETRNVKTQPSDWATKRAAEAEDAYQRGVVLQERDPGAARLLFIDALVSSDPASSTQQKARAQLEMLEGDDSVLPASVKSQSRSLYLKGYQLRDSDPAEARRLFHQVIAWAPGGSDAQKARSRLEELDASPGLEPPGKSVARVITLAINERVSISVKDVSRTVIRNSTVAEVRVLGADKLEVKGLSHGEATVLIWTNDNRRMDLLLRVSEPARGAMGLLKIASNPIGADVIIDGKATGRRTPVLPSDPLEVPVGRHTIQFEWNGKKSAIQTLDVIEGANPVIRGEIPQ